MISTEIIKNTGLYTGHPAEDSLTEAYAIQELVRTFSTEMENRMLNAFARGKTGWDDLQCAKPIALAVHDLINKGNMVRKAPDIANYLMMLHNMSLEDSDAVQDAVTGTDIDELYYDMHVSLSAQYKDLDNWRSAIRDCEDVGTHYYNLMIVGIKDAGVTTDGRLDLTGTRNSYTLSKTQTDVAVLATWKGMIACIIDYANKAQSQEVENKET